MNGVDGQWIDHLRLKLHDTVPKGSRDNSKQRGLKHDEI